MATNKKLPIVGGSRELADYAGELRATGRYTEAQIRAKYAEREREMQKSAGQAPAGLSQEQIKLLNAQRALEDLPPYETSKSEPAFRAPTEAEVDRAAFDRACGGGEPEPRYEEYCPRGWSKERLARENFERAFKELPALQPHPDDSDDGED
jgi:hypothetical protein